MGRGGERRDGNLKKDKAAGDNGQIELGCGIRHTFICMYDPLGDPVAHATSEIHACINHFHCFIKHRKVSLVRTPSALLHNLVFSHAQCLVVIHYHPSMVSYYDVGVQFCSINWGPRSLIHPRTLQTHIRACLSQQLCFFRADKTGLHLSWSSAVDYRQQTGFSRTYHSFCWFFVTACLNAPSSRFCLFQFRRSSSNWFYLPYPIISNSFFQPCKRVVVYFPSASLSPSWKSGKTSSVCLAQSRFFPPTRSHSPSFLHFLVLLFFFLLVLSPKQGRSSPEAEHFNNSRCKVVFPVLKHYSH